MEIRRVGAMLFRTDRRTDRHNEANSRFRQFCGRAKKNSLHSTREVKKNGEIQWAVRKAVRRSISPKINSDFMFVKQYIVLWLSFFLILELPNNFNFKSQVQDIKSIYPIKYGC